MTPEHLILESGKMEFASINMGTPEDGFRRGQV